MGEEEQQLDRVRQHLVLRRKAPAKGPPALRKASVRQPNRVPGEEPRRQSSDTPGPSEGEHPFTREDERRHPR